MDLRHRETEHNKGERRFLSSYVYVVARDSWNERETITQ